MSFTVRYKYSRPNKTIAWYIENTPADVVKHIKDTYFTPGLLLGIKKEGVGGLVLTLTNEWKDRDSALSWWEDPQLADWHRGRETYNNDNGIVIVSEEMFYN